MSAPSQKVVVLKAESRVSSRPEVTDRDFWMTMRQTLLMQLAIIEKKLGLKRRCQHCGHAS